MKKRTTQKDTSKKLSLRSEKLRTMSDLPEDKLKDVAGGHCSYFSLSTLSG
jgi:hypothetical protein